MQIKAYITYSPHQVVAACSWSLVTITCSSCDCAFRFIKSINRHKLWQYSCKIKEKEKWVNEKWINTPSFNNSFYILADKSKPTPICCIYIKLLQNFSSQGFSWGFSFRIAPNQAGSALCWGRIVWFWPKQSFDVSTEMEGAALISKMTHDISLLNAWMTEHRRWTSGNKY